MASSFNVSVNQTRNLVLTGRAGNGKSSTGNSILRRNAFLAKMSPKSVTEECKMHKCTRKGGKVNVIDTPGVFDTNESREDVGREIVKCINLAEGGIHAFLLVVKLDRFTDEEAESIYILQLLFGPKIFDYMIVVFTGGDKLEIPLQDYLKDCPRSLKKTISLCNSRMVVFNNHKRASTNVKEIQITALLKQVDGIVANNRGRPYSNDLFLKAQEMPLQLYHVKDTLKQYEKDLKRVTDEYEKRLNKTMKKNALAMQEMKAELKEMTKKNALATQEMKAELKEKMKKNALATQEMKAELKEKMEKHVLAMQGEKAKLKSTHCAAIGGQIAGPILGIPAQILIAAVSGGSCTIM